MNLNEPSDIWKQQGNWLVRLYEPYIKESWIEGLNYLLRTTPISNFKVRQNFENELADYCNSPYAIAVNSGTSAILIGMIAMGLKQGDTVIGPNYGNLAWANCCKFLGINVMTIDVRFDNFCLDEEILETKLKSKSNNIKGVCYINQAGYTGKQLEKVVDICKKYNVILFEDSCNAIGQNYLGKHAGTFGDIGFISFGVPKLLTCGEGGAILIKDKEIYDRCNDLAYQGGWYSPPSHTKLTMGINFVMPVQNAYFLSKQLEDIDELLRMRKKVTDLYKAKLPIQRYHQAPSIYEYYSTSPLKVLKKAEQLKVQLLFKSYVPFGHLFNNQIESTPVSSNLSEHILTLPSSLTLTKESVDLILGSIKLGEL